MEWCQAGYKIGDKITFDITESEAEKALVVCVMFTVYKGTSYKYPGFATSEAYTSLLDYGTSWLKTNGDGCYNIIGGQK